MSDTVKNIVLGNLSIVSLDEAFGEEYNIQNERYKKILLMFISRMKNEVAYGRMKPEMVDIKVNELMRMVSNPGSLANQYILGTEVQMENLDVEMDTLLGLYKKAELDDVEDIFSIDKNKAIGLSDAQINEYGLFPELLERDLEYGVITIDQAKLIREKLEKEAAEGMRSSKVLTKTKPGLSDKKIELGFIEPVLLSLVVSGIGLLYVAYLYLVV